jgi:hypothetical protein
MIESIDVGSTAFKSPPAGLASLNFATNPLNLGLQLIVSSTSR